MAHRYRNLEHWDHWLAKQFLGKKLLEAEHNLLKKILTRHLGKQALLIGVPEQYNLLDTSSIPCHTLVTSIIAKEKKTHLIEGDFHELPIATGSIDLVIMPHILEFVESPRQLLSEACRIVRPEGLIAVCGFNPKSWWGVRQKVTHKKTIPWSGNFIPVQSVRGWLQLADFKMEEQRAALFTPPVGPALFEKLAFFEKIGSHFLPTTLGGVYVLIARAKVIPLTPIKLKWKQQLRGIDISTTISGHIAREVLKR